MKLWTLARDAPRAPEVLAEVLSVRGVGTPSRTLNSLAVLEEMGLAEARDDGVLLAHDRWAEDDVHDGLRQEVLAHYCRLLPGAALGPVFQHDVESGELQVDRVLLPFRDLGLPFLLVEFGLVVRSNIRALTVAPDATAAFLEVLAAINAKAMRARPMTPAELEAWLAARRAAGETAEAFAMDFEHRRLGGHRLLSQVRWIATEDVGAGFDILSFDDQRSLLLDRSIEVKGYAGERTFHWSAEEVAAARLKREKYWLYLVDRDRVGEQGYTPEMVSDPYTYFIEENPAGWLREPTSFRFTAPVATG